MRHISRYLLMARGYDSARRSGVPKGSEKAGLEPKLSAFFRWPLTLRESSRAFVRAHRQWSFNPLLDRSRSRADRRDLVRDVRCAGFLRVPKFRKKKPRRSGVGGNAVRSLRSSSRFALSPCCKAKQRQSCQQHCIGLRLGDRCDGVGPDRPDT